MKVMVKRMVGALVLTLATMGISRSQDAIKTSGAFFGDLYYIANSNVDTLKNRYGFLMRRVNLNFDKMQDENVNIRVRLEMEGPNVDRTPEVKLTPYLKDAFISLKTFETNFTFGIQPTLVFENVEKIWGFRFVEKTVLDFQRVIPSRDFGISVSRKISMANLSLLAAKGGKSNYTVYSAIVFDLTKNLLFEVTGRYEKENDTTTSILIHPFLGYKSENLRAGLEFTYLKKNGEASKFLSLFASKEVTRRAEVFVRFDRAFEANSQASKITYMVLSNNSPMNLIFTGLSYKIAKKTTISPNFAYAMYDDDNIKNDFYLKLTFNVGF
ncbi:MAG: hypothetical protein ACPLN0_07045 [Candidatus Hydrothermia bacterium]